MDSIPLVFFSLWTIIFFIQIVLSNQQRMYNSCSSAEPCTDIRRCDLFAPYHTMPARWNASLKDTFMTRFCAKEASTNGGNVFKVCCPKSSTTPPAREWRRRIDLLDLQGCGVYSEDRVAVTVLFQFPWMALLRSYGSWICGGTLINVRYVLTAAQCVKDTTIDIVRLGEFDLNQPIDCFPRAECAPIPQDIAIESTIIHEEYSVRRKVNDIALLRLVHAATENENVIPICLPVTPEMQPAVATYYVAGWGTREYKKHSNVLHHTKLILVPKDECQMQIRKEDHLVQISDTQLCTRSVNNHSDYCSADTGGPLKSLGKNGRLVQYGVVSFGLSACGKQSSAGVYTRVESFIDWIVDKLED